MPIVERTHKADADLISLWNYIAQESVSSADKLLSKIEEKSLLYAQNPRLGRLRPEIQPELRSFAVSPYVVFYTPIEDGIYIIRVLHGRRDVRAIFQSD